MEGTIQSYMTGSPHSVGMDQTLAFAKQHMRELGIRHLPVLSGGKLMGLLSERDVALVEALRDVDPAKVSVEEAMSQDVVTVTPETPLAEVASRMAEQKLGSVVVMQGSKVVGIFTTVDLARTLVTLLRPH